MCINTYIVFYVYLVGLMLGPKSVCVCVLVCLCACVLVCSRAPLSFGFLCPFPEKAQKLATPSTRTVGPQLILKFPNAPLSG